LTWVRFGLQDETKESQKSAGGPRQSESLKMRLADLSLD
jgi:hypothetical protein